MKTCSKCGHRLPLSSFRTRETRNRDGFSRISLGSICHGCEARRHRFRRGTQTVKDVVQEVLLVLNG